MKKSCQVLGRKSWGLKLKISYTNKMEQFSKLGLSKGILEVIQKKGFTKPSEIQVKTIPLVLEGKDIIAGSSTGSGKTLAFGAGIIDNSNKGEGIQSLVLTPTRELCEQVSNALADFSRNKRLEVVSVYGGVSLENQVKKLSYADVVVATQGRLLDHLERKSLDLSKIKILVLDEADRMWDMGFKEDVSKIVKTCPKKRQTLLFSATITSDLADFSNKYMNSPVEVSAESFVDPTKLKQVYYDVPDNGKFSLLVYLLKNENAHLVMIFCNTRRNADFVCKNLKTNGIEAQVIHGGMEQPKRNRVLKSFDNTKVNVFVCTDVAARGLDIKGVSHVYNYDTASDPKDHVHRIGRTARAGKEGIAINIIASRDYDNFSNVQRHNPGLKIERKETPHYERVFVKWDEDQGRFPRRSGGRQSGNRGPPRRGPPRSRGEDFRSGPPRRNEKFRSPRGNRGGQSQGRPFRSRGDSSRGGRPSFGRRDSSPSSSRDDCRSSRPQRPVQRFGSSRPQRNDRPRR